MSAERKLEYQVRLTAPSPVSGFIRVAETTAHSAAASDAMITSTSPKGDASG